MTNAIFHFMWRQEPQEHTLGLIWGVTLVSGENILRGLFPTTLSIFLFQNWGKIKYFERILNNSSW